MPWNDGLSGPHLNIASYSGPSLRVLAGPGTGKTFALMRRVARLLEEGVETDRILVCTFTRTAARDLQKELRTLLIQGVDEIRSGTLHAFCFSLMNREQVLSLTGRVPRPLLKFEERFLLMDLNDDVFGGITDREKRLQAFNAAWARLQTDQPGWPTDTVDRTFHTALLAWQRFHKSILIGEIVPVALNYLRENPACEELSNFQHVLVDEYQDLNRAEQELITLLASAGTLTIIGDEDQSIYSFKHAHPEGIANFHQIHGGTHDEPLTECRRCPQRIVKMANNLIEKNTSRTPRVLNHTPSSPNGEIFIIQWPSMKMEAEGIGQFIKERVQAQLVDPGRILVLAPRRQFGYAIRDELNSRGIPAHSFFHEEAFDGNPKVLEESAAQQAFTLLSLLANPDDRVALRSWCGFGSPSLRTGSWARLRAHCEQSGESPWLALESLEAGNAVLTRSSDLIHRFRDLKFRLDILKALTGQQLVAALFPPSISWTEPFRHLGQQLEGDFDAIRLRDALRVGMTQPELPTDVDYVRVMSLHKSKGLTADLVVVVGCIQGLIPSVKNDLQSLEQARLLEEHRRLFYVAITRTKNTLVLSSVVRLPRKTAYLMRVPVHGGTRTQANTIASQFLGDLGPTRPQTVLGNTILSYNGGHH